METYLTVPSLQKFFKDTPVFRVSLVICYRFGTFSVSSFALALFCSEPSCPMGSVSLQGTAAADSLEPGMCQILSSLVFCLVMEAGRK